MVEYCQVVVCFAVISVMQNRLIYWVQSLVQFRQQVSFMTFYFLVVFRLDALAKALSVIATATWLGGWVAGCLSQPVLYQND